MAQPLSLPIYEIQNAIVDAVIRGNRVIISAPTGSGKSTQVPQIVLGSPEVSDGQVVVMQPRRIAARLLARRVAWERKCELGQEVGYQVRFENVTSRRTRIRFVTEGVLLRQMLQDGSLSGVSTLIFDEFHERHLYGDVTLARALDLQRTHRPDLRVLVMSATLDLTLLERYLAPAQLLVSSGRTYPVEVRFASTPAYLEKRPVWEQAADVFAEYAAAGESGDVLVFMPGVFEINQTLEALRRRPESRGYALLPLHGELASADQDAAVAGEAGRKVVVATNVAETSLTIPGVRCVIDSGLARVSRYDPGRGINTLLIEKISRASADQRAGRAGRTAPGVCVRLWSQEEHGFRPAHELPEIKRLDIAEAVLALKAAGILNLKTFSWLEPPDAVGLQHAEELLTDLGALRPVPGSEDIEITELGRRMLAFPVHPRYARMLLAAEDYDCVREACLVAALTQGRDLLLRNVSAQSVSNRENLAGSDNDFDRLIALWEVLEQQRFSPQVCTQYGVHTASARQVAPLFKQFLDLARQQGLTVREKAPVRPDALRKCVLSGFSDRVGRRMDSAGAKFELARGRRGTLARESLAGKSELIVAAEVSELEGRDKNVSTVLSLATGIQAEWLEELFPDEITRRSRAWFDPTAKRVYAEEQFQFRGLAIASKRVEPPPPDDAARLLAEEVLTGRLAIDDWDDTVEQWIVRLNLLSQWCPELELPCIGADDRRALVEDLCHGVFSGKELKEKPVKALVKSWLSPAQQQLLEKHAPERLFLRNGRQARVHYDTANPPYIALRIQELFGVNASPVIGMGRAPVSVRILAPSMRPVQITQDLARFWKEHYPRVRQELQRKYPRHKWPEVPP